ncbi:MAG: hypothetical protein QM668_09290 [Agriterribacter sp.]
MTIFIPFAFLFKNLVNIAAVRKSYYGLLFIACLVSIYYCNSALSAPTTYPFTFKDIWLFPLRDIRYKRNVSFNPNQKVVLNDGKTILYISSENDDLCLHVSLPCMPWNYGVVEMRGEKITDGFRLTKDLIKEKHPFLNY